jgi:hypothetical protein
VRRTRNIHRINPDSTVEIETRARRDPSVVKTMGLCL